MPRTQNAPAPAQKMLCYGNVRSANGTIIPCIRRATIEKNGLTYCSECAKSVRKESK